MMPTETSTMEQILNAQLHLHKVEGLEPTLDWMEDLGFPTDLDDGLLPSIMQDLQQGSLDDAQGFCEGADYDYSLQVGADGSCSPQLITTADVPGWEERAAVGNQFGDVDLFGGNNNKEQWMQEKDDDRNIFDIMEEDIPRDFSSYGLIGEGSSTPKPTCLEGTEAVPEESCSWNQEMRWGNETIESPEALEMMQEDVDVLVPPASSPSHVAYSEQQHGDTPPTSPPRDGRATGWQQCVGGLYGDSSPSSSEACISGVQDPAALQVYDEEESSQLTQEGDFVMEELAPGPQGYSGDVEVSPTFMCRDDGQLFDYEEKPKIAMREKVQTVIKEKPRIITVPLSAVMKNKKNIKILPSIFKNNPKIEILPRSNLPKVANDRMASAKDVIYLKSFSMPKVKAEVKPVLTDVISTEGDYLLQELLSTSAKPARSYHDHDADYVPGPSMIPRKKKHTVEEKKLRKKEQNKRAALRYREKKKEEGNAVTERLAHLKETIASDEETLQRLRVELELVNGLVRDKIRNELMRKLEERRR